MKDKKINCAFCKKPLTKKVYKVRDKYNTLQICDKCDSKVKQYQKEYNLESEKLQKEFNNKLEQLSNHLRKKYGLKRR